MSTEIPCAVSGWAAGAWAAVQQTIGATRVASVAASTLFGTGRRMSELASADGHLHHAESCCSTRTAKPAGLNVPQYSEWSRHLRTCSNRIAAIDHGTRAPGAAIPITLSQVL